MNIGLTGGVATGKTRVGDWFAEQGWTVICTDRMVHQLYGPGQSLPRELAKKFGSSILTAEGGVERHRLGEIVFQDETKLKQLNSMVHPLVRAEWKRRAAESVSQGKATMTVIPLLYETGAEGEFDQVWVVACSQARQKERLQERGFEGDQITRRLASQWPLQKKIDLANLMIWNDGEWSLTEEQLREIAATANSTLNARNFPTQGKTL